MIGGERPSWRGVSTARSISARRSLSPCFEVAAEQASVLSCFLESFKAKQLGMLLKLSAKLSYCVSGGSPVTRSFWLRREVSSSSDADYYIRSLQQRGWRASPRPASSRPPAPLLRTCCGCGCDLTKEAFATRQWARPTRVCITCTRSSIDSQRVHKKTSSIAAEFVPPAPRPAESSTADSQPESYHFRPATVTMPGHDPSCDAYLTAADDVLTSCSVTLAALEPPSLSGASLFPGASRSNEVPSSFAPHAASVGWLPRGGASHPKAPTRQRHNARRPTPLQRAQQHGGLGALGGPRA